MKQKQPYRLTPQVTYISILRLIVALAIFAAIYGQARHSMAVAPNFHIANFFSYFTILSNSIALLLLTIMGFGALTGAVSNRTIEFLRGGVVVYMATTGIVAALFLQNLPGAADVTLGWSDAILHRWAPLYIVLDWLLIGASHVPLRQAAWWLLFPLLWLPYTMIRGASTDWYPYPFLNPAPPHSVAGVIGMCVLIAGGMIGLCWLVSAVSGRRKAISIR